MPNKNKVILWSVLIILLGAFLFPTKIEIHNTIKDNTEDSSTVIEDISTPHWTIVNGKFQPSEFGLTEEQKNELNKSMEQEAREIDKLLGTDDNEVPVSTSVSTPVPANKEPVVSEEIPHIPEDENLEVSPEELWILRVD